MSVHDRFSLEELRMSTDAEARKYARMMQQALVDIGFWKCCLSCNHWGSNDPEHGQRQENMCHKFNILPPPSVIIYSCVEAWIPVIPF